MKRKTYPRRAPKGDWIWDSPGRWQIRGWFQQDKPHGAVFRTANWGCIFSDSWREGDTLAKVED